MVYNYAGADAILIHSKHSQPDEILAFAGEWANRAPLVIVPTTTLPALSVMLDDFFIKPVLASTWRSSSPQCEVM